MKVKVGKISPQYLCDERGFLRKGVAPMLLQLGAQRVDEMEYFPDYRCSLSG